MTRIEPDTWTTTLWRGVRGRCPHCGEGHMFRGFLKVADRCAACGEELFHHRADDFPAYLVILAVGHVVVPALLYTQNRFDTPAWFDYAFWPLLTLALALALIQPVKGAVVAVQWRMGMHGFALSRRPATLASPSR